MPIPTTRDFSVKFGRQPDLGLEGQKTFPFIYTLINHTDDQWQPVPAGTLPSLVNIGPTINPASALTHYVRLDPDYNFKLIAIKYTVYSAVRGTYYQWYDLRPGIMSDGMDPDMDKIGTPLIRYLQATVSFQGSSSYILYGGQNTQPMTSNNGAPRIPLQMELSQGYDSGYYTVRTPYLLPREGVIVFELTNTHPTASLTVGAAIYGMKIRL